MEIHEELGAAAALFCRSPALPCASSFRTSLTTLFSWTQIWQSLLLLQAFISGLYHKDKGFFSSYCKFLSATRQLLSCRFDIGRPCFGTEVI